MISEIYTIIEKNIKRLIRSKTSALIVVFGPIFMILLVGIAFSNSSLYGIKIGVFSDEYDKTTVSIIDYIKSTDFNVVYEKSAEDCKENVKNGKRHLCIIFPNDNNTQKKLEFHIDYSKLNLVYTLLNILTSGLSEHSSQISMGLTQDLLETLKTTSDDIKDNTDIIYMFRTDIEKLGLKLVDINESVNGINLNFDFESANLTGLEDNINRSEKDIESFGSGVTGDIELYKKKLESLEIDADALREELINNRDVIESIHINISNVYDGLGCNSTEDIFSIWDVETISNKISQASEPECAILFSMERVIKQREGSLDEAIEELDNVHDEIESAKDDLDSADNNIDSILDNTENKFLSTKVSINSMKGSINSAKAKVAEFNTLKDSLNTDISTIKMTLDSGLDDIDSLNSMLDTVVENLEDVTLATPESIIKPITTEIKPLIKNKNTLDYLFPSLIILIITFTSILLSSTVIMKEKSSNAYFRNFITPTSNLMFIYGTFLTSFIVVFCQCIILFLTASVFFKVSIFSNIFYIAIAIVPITSIFIFIGMIIGYILNSEETTTLASICISCIFILFSSMIIPIENMSSGIGAIARASPFVLSEIILRQLIIFRGSFMPVISELFFVIIYIAILFGLVVITRKLSKHFIVE